jgi:hypothetical protein
MIYCPKCGTANRDGSRFCNECGEKLGSQTQIKCPHCGVLNSVQSVFCSECGGRLLVPPSSGPSTRATPAIKGLSLPTKAPLSPDDQAVSDDADTSEAEDLPAWLRELGGSLSSISAPGESTPSEGSTDIPDWLQDLRASLPEEPEANASGAEEADEEQIPDWLSELQPSAEAPEAEPEAEPEPELELEEGEVPDWLAELRPSAEAPEAEPEAEPEPEPELEEGEVPDWLAELQPSAEAPEAEPEAEPEPELELEEGELPDWLTELRPSAEAPEPELEAKPELEGEEEEEEEEPPDWLAELRPSPEVLEPEDESKAEPEPPEVEPAKPASVPEWLADLQADLPPEPAPQDEGELAELPDWLVPSSMEGGEETLVRAEIPSWLLELKPRELREEGEEEAAGPEPVLEEQIEETGLLAGLQGTLPVEMLIAQPRASTAPRMVSAGAVDLPQARLFAEIVARPPEAVPKSLAQPARHGLGFLSSWIVYIALIAAVTLPLLVGDSLITRTVEPSASVEALYNTIESLAPGAPVLVAFDYDPTTGDEMNVLAQAIVGHLMERRALVVAVSLLPAGPATAESQLEALATGQPYVNLGYLPGQVAAVRLMGQSLSTAQLSNFQGTPLTDVPAMARVTSIKDFDLIVELAATQTTLRWWIEQVIASYDVPLAAGVSAAVDPLARPYYETESRQLVGLVGGVPDAATYEALRNGQSEITGPLGSRLNSQLAGHAVLVLVLLVGNVVYLVRRGAGRER